MWMIDSSQEGQNILQHISHLLLAHTSGNHFTKVFNFVPFQLRHFSTQLRSLGYWQHSGKARL
jgi:hypothetical protein